MSLATINSFYGGLEPFPYRGGSPHLTTRTWVLEGVL